MTQLIAPAYCANCRHYGDRVEGARVSALARAVDGTPFGHACKAFPDGIPAAVWSGEVAHDQAIAGDNGIRFEALDAARETPSRPLYTGGN